MARASRKKAGKIAGKASKHCKGKRGKSFQACRRAFYREHRK